MPDRKIRILLLNPWIYDFAAYDLWVQPLGVLLLAARLRHAGAEVHFLDCLDSYHPGLKGITSREGRKFQCSRRKPWGRGKFFCEIIEKPRVLSGIPRHYRRYGIPPELFREQLTRIEQPDAVLVTSGMTYWYPGVQAAILYVKEAYPAVPVVLGGGYATLLPRHAREYSGADFVFPGIAEDGFGDFLSEILGIGSGGFSLPPGVWSSYPELDLRREILSAPVLTSRGCSFRCSYCASRILFPGTFQRSSADVIEEIQFWYRERGVQDFVFFDDALLSRGASEVIEILKSVHASGIRCRFHSPNGIHIRGMSADLAAWMRCAGWRTVRLGLESSEPGFQATTGGKVKNQEFIDAIRCLRSSGYPREDIGVYVLAGLPGQRAEEVEATIRYVQEQGARPVIAEYSPIPGTELWKDAVQISPFDIAREPLFQNNTILPCGGDDLTYEDLGRLKQLCQKS